MKTKLIITGRPAHMHECFQSPNCFIRRDVDRQQSKIQRGLLLCESNSSVSVDRDKKEKTAFWQQITSVKNHHRHASICDLFSSFFDSDQDLSRKINLGFQDYG